MPASDVPSRPLEELLPADAVALSPPDLPELAEPDVIRHFTNLSTLNMSVDTHFYPLGSCTMKYNPKRNERLVSLPGFADLHPYQPDETVPGLLELLYELQEILAEISGLDAVSLQPAAGAQGEMTALMVAAAYFRDRGEKRTKVLAPDSAHGTNPASAAVAGFEAVTVKSTPRGFVDLDDLRAHLDDQTAVFMITNPEHAGHVRPRNQADCRPGACRRRTDLPGRRQHERHSGRHPAGRFRRRHDAFQSAQNVQRPARRRRSRSWPDRGHVATWLPYLPTPVVERTRRRLSAGLRPAAIDRPRAQLLRPGGRARSGLLLHPHARRRGPATRQRKRGAERQLSAVAASSTSCLCRKAIAACTSSWLRRPT